MLLGLLLTLNILVCLALIGVVLLQKSEGGALGGGGGPTGLITSRGAGDLLTRTTWVLFALFLSLSLALTLLSARGRSDEALVGRLKSLSINPDTIRKPASGAAAPGAQQTAPPPTAPSQGQPSPVQLPPLSGGSAPGQPARQPAPSATGPTLPLALPPLTPQAPGRPGAP